MGRKKPKHAERIYMGVRTNGEAKVWIAWPGGGRWLRCRHRKGFWNHSADVEWGYGGSGPAQLALELLADATGDIRRAVRSHQAYKFAVVGGLPAEGWSLHREAVLSVLERIEREASGVSDWRPEDRVTLPNYKDN